MQELECPVCIQELRQQPPDRVRQAEYEYLDLNLPETVVTIDTDGRYSCNVPTLASLLTVR